MSRKFPGDADRLLNKISSLHTSSQLPGSAGSSTESSLRSPVKKKPRMVCGQHKPSSKEDPNVMYLKQLELYKQRVDLLSKQSSIVEEIKSFGSNASSSSSKIQFAEATPRMIEVPPKRPCLGLQNLADTKQKSIWTQRNVQVDNVSKHSDEDFKIVNERFVLKNLKDPHVPQKDHSGSPLHIEPHVIVIDNESDSSSISDDEIGTFRTHVTSISSRSIKVSPSISPDSLSPKSSPGSVKRKPPLDKDYLRQFCRSPVNSPIAENTYTVSTLLTSKDLTEGFKKFLHLGRNNQAKKLKESKSEEIEDEELEYISDEVEMRTINYSDYYLPVKKLNDLPDAKSSQDLIKTIAKDVFKLPEVSAKEDDAASPEPNETVSFKHISDELRNRAASLTNTSMPANRERSAERAKVDKETVDKRKDVELEEVCEDVRCEPIVLEEAGCRSVTMDDDDEETASGCCDFCSELIFPKREERFF